MRRRSGRVIDCIRWPIDPTISGGPPGRGDRGWRTPSVDVVVLAVEVDRALGEQRADDREGFLEAADPVVVGESEGGVLAKVPAGAERRESTDRSRPHRRWRPSWRASPARESWSRRRAGRAGPARSMRRVRRVSSTPPTVHVTRRAGRTADGHPTRSNRTRPARRAAPSR